MANSKRIFYVLVLAISICTIITGCNNRIEPPAPENLYEKYRKAVVLIRHSYYYKIKLGDGFDCYAILKDGRPLIIFDENEAKEQANTIYGTGFFVTKDGQIMTNKHVVEPKIGEGLTDSLTNLRDLFNTWSSAFLEKAKRTLDTVSILETYLSNYRYSISSYKAYEIQQYADDLNNKAQRSFNIASSIRINGNTVKIITMTTFLGVAYDNSFVTSVSDFSKCVVIKKPVEDNIDLAVIQLKDKTTPLAIKDVFNYDEHNPNIANHTAVKGDTFNINAPVKINTKVYMIGFNYGIELANTDNGIKSQFTQGTVSQESDNNRILYTIPALEGSSGSPIIDQWGNLIAVNFAKISNTQNFTFGVPSKHSKQTLEAGIYKEPISTLELSSSYDDYYQYSNTQQNTLEPSYEEPVETQERNEQVYVDVYSSSPINKSPSTMSEEITRAYKGRVVILGDYNNEFYYAECNGIRGYLAKKWVK